MNSTTTFKDIPAWPEQAGSSPPPKDHNNPPIEAVVAAEFRDELLRERPDFMTKLEGIIGAVDRAVITDDKTLGLAGDLDNLMRAADSHITAVHQAVKKPYLDGGRAADGEKNLLINRLATAKANLKGMMNKFVAERAAIAAAAEAVRVAEERRLAAVAAAAAEARRKAEAAADEARKAAALANEPFVESDLPPEPEVAPLAAAAPVRAAPVRSDGGASVSTTTVWNVEIEDYLAAFKAVKTDPKVKAEIEGAIKRQVRAGSREIKGVRIWPTQQAVSR